MRRGYLMSANVGKVRTEIADIETMCQRLLTESTHKGVNSEAAMLNSKTANPEAWRQRRRYGYLDNLADRLGEDHPMWVLGTWDLLVTEHLGHGHRTQQITVETAAAYIKANLTDLSRDAEFPFSELADDVHRCHAHLEDVLRDGERDEKGAPCPACGHRNLVKDFGKQQDKPCDCGPQPTLEHAEHGRCDCSYGLRVEQPDENLPAVTVRVYHGDEFPPIGHVHSLPDLDCIACQRESAWATTHAAHVEAAEPLWVCPNRMCHQTWTERDYRMKVGAAYVLHARTLSASQIREAYRVPEGTVRRWASGKNPTVRTRGKDAQGRQLYDVGDVLDMRDRVAATDSIEGQVS
jgi:DNA-directed RNA polymerase subunit RPC12/RpoP